MDSFTNNTASVSEIKGTKNTENKVERLKENINNSGMYAAGNKHNKKLFFFSLDSFGDSSFETPDLRYIKEQGCMFMFPIIIHTYIHTLPLSPFSFYTVYQYIYFFLPNINLKISYIYNDKHKNSHI